MKLHGLIILFGLFAFACEKTSNVTAMQDEVTGLTNKYKQRFDELSKRISLLEQRGRSMVSVGTPEGLNDVRKLFLDSNKRLAELKTAVAQAPGSLAQASKAENPRVELIKLLGELDGRLRKGEIEVNASIDQVEQWLAYVEYRPKVAAAEPKKVEPPPMPEPTPSKEELSENPDTMRNPNKDPGAPVDPPKTEPKKEQPKKEPAKVPEPKKEEPKKEPAKVPEPKTEEPKKVPRPG